MVEGKKEQAEEEKVSYHEQESTAAAKKNLATWIHEHVGGGEATKKRVMERNLGLQPRFVLKNGNINNL